MMREKNTGGTCFLSVYSSNTILSGVASSCNDKLTHSAHVQCAVGNVKNAQIERLWDLKRCLLWTLTSMPGF